MTTSDHMPPLSKELEAMLRAERPVPSPPGGLQERVFEKLADTLVWGGPGAGGGGAGGMSGAATFFVVALVAAGLGGIAYYKHSHNGVEGNSSASKSASLAIADPIRLHTGADNSLPTWFGEATRPSRPIAGHVTYGGSPVPGAHVVLESAMTRAGVTKPQAAVANDEGWFTFGEMRAAWYDISASAPEMGYGHVQVATHDPTTTSDQLAIRLSGCEHVLYGVVRDASGGVIVGAAVRPTSGEWARTVPFDVGVVSDHQGRYELCARAGQIGAVVSAQGYGAVHILDKVIGRKQFDVELVPEATLVGRVVQDGDGEPVSGMAIWLYPAAWPERLRTANAVAVSDSQGNFLIEGVSPGRHQLVGTSRHSSVRVTPVLIQSAGETPEILLRAEGRVTVRGKVVDSGRPVRGARIFSALGGRRQGVFTIADAQGEFSLWPLVPGVIEFEVDGYEVISPAEYDLTTASDNEPVVIAVVKGGAIIGKVLFEGRPVVDAEVRATGATEKGSASARSDENGVFELRGLAAGRYELTASSDAAIAFSTTAKAVDLGAQEDRSGVILELDGSATIAGTVLDQQDALVAGVMVHYVHLRTGDACSATTDRRGEFTCGPLAGGGSYTPSVRPDTSSALQFPPAQGERLQQVLLADGTSQVTREVLHIQANREYISGRVVSRDGEPHPDTRVRAIEASTGYTPATAPWLGLRSGVSGADGSFQIAVWEGSQYTLHARTPTGGEGTLAKVEAGSTGVVIQVEEPGDIEGTLVGFDGPPKLLVRRLGNTVDIVSARVDSTAFSAQGLTPGHYAVFALSGSRGSAQTAIVQPGKTTSMELVAGPSARLEIRVIDFVTGEPVSGVRCNAAPYIHDAGIFGWGTSWSKPTDALGSVSFDGPSGPIEIACLPRHRNTDAARQVQAKPGQENRVTVYLVDSDSPADSSSGIGARLHMGFDEPSGGYTHTIVELRPGGAAEKAGLRIGDMIVQVNGSDVSVLTDIGLLVGTHAIGSMTKLTVRRGQVLHTLSVVVEAPWH